MIIDSSARLSNIILLFFSGLHTENKKKPGWRDGKRVISSVMIDHVRTVRDRLCAITICTLSYKGIVGRVYYEMYKKNANGRR